MSKDRYVGPVYVLRLAYIYLRLGEQDSALEQLDRYLAADRSYYINRLLLDPRIDPIRDDPRFQALSSGIDRARQMC